MSTATRRSLHPMIMVACIAVLLLSAAGIAAIMGWIPDSFGRNAESADTVTEKKPEPKTPSIAKKQQPIKNPGAPIHLAGAAKPDCANCGVIESVRAIETRGEGSGVGAVGGAVVGGLLGNQLGGGHGKEAMTVVGAVGGALAGNHIEKRVKATTRYEIIVRMDNGASRSFNESAPPAWRSGDHVRIVDGAIRNT